MADSTVVKNMRDGTIKLKDGTATPLVLTVTLDEGNLTYAMNANPSFTVFDRGVISHVRKGDEVPITGSFSVKYVDLIAPDAAANETLYEVITKTDDASDWISTSTGTDVYTLDLEFLINDPGGGTDETVTFPDCAFTDVEFAEGDEFDTLSVSFTSIATRPTVAHA